MSICLVDPRSAAPLFPDQAGGISGCLWTGTCLDGSHIAGLLNDKLVLWSSKGSLVRQFATRGETIAQWIGNSHIIMCPFNSTVGMVVLNVTNGNLEDYLVETRDRIFQPTHVQFVSTHMRFGLVAFVTAAADVQTLFVSHYRPDHEHFDAEPINCSLTIRKLMVFDLAHVCVVGDNPRRPLMPYEIMCAGDNAIRNYVFEEPVHDVTFVCGSMFVLFSSGLTIYPPDGGESMQKRVPAGSTRITRGAADQVLVWSPAGRVVSALEWNANGSRYVTERIVSTTHDLKQVVMCDAQHGLAVTVDGGLVMFDARLRTPWAELMSNGGELAAETPRIAGMTAAQAQSLLTENPNWQANDRQALRDSVCFVCLTEAPVGCFVPCGHAGFCRGCAPAAAQELRGCPNRCNDAVFMRLFMS